MPFLFANAHTLTSPSPPEEGLTEQVTLITDSTQLTPSEDTLQQNYARSAKIRESENTREREYAQRKHTHQAGLVLTADASLVANYIWRGLYVGGLSMQASARANYYGLFADMWWNIGATDWAFTGFNPEVDITVGFDRWGVQLYWLHAVYFDGTHFFNFDNAAPGEAGNTDELRFRYRISDRVPLSFLWCTRLVGRDGYLSNGELRRAYSSYFEFKYEFALPYAMSLHTTVGMTPWRSLYTGFEGGFAVVNVDVSFHKVWQLRGCAVSLAGDLMLNPWRVTKDNIRWKPRNPSAQRLNANITVGIAWTKRYP